MDALLLVCLASSLLILQLSFFDLVMSLDLQAKGNYRCFVLPLSTERTIVCESTSNAPLTCIYCKPINPLSTCCVVLMAVCV